MISRRLKNKLHSIIFGLDYQAHKQFYHGSLNSMTPGIVKPNYSMYTEDRSVGWLLTQLTEDEKVELTKFDSSDLSKILYTDVKNQMHGILLNELIKRNETNNKKN